MAFGCFGRECGIGCCFDLCTIYKFTNVMCRIIRFIYTPLEDIAGWQKCTDVQGQA